MALSIAAFPVSAGLGIGLMSLGYYSRLGVLVGSINQLDGSLVAKQSLLNQLEAREASESERKTVTEQINLLEGQLNSLIHRAYLYRRTLFFFMLSLACLFISSFWTLLADYWIGFFYFGLVTVMSAMIFMFVAACFAILELNHTLDNENMDTRVCVIFI